MMRKPVAGDDEFEQRPFDRESVGELPADHPIDEARGDCSEGVTGREMQDWAVGADVSRDALDDVRVMDIEPAEGPSWRLLGKIIAMSRRHQGQERRSRRQRLWPPAGQIELAGSR